jgi:hypothetical protein
MWMSSTVGEEMYIMISDVSKDGKDEMMDGKGVYVWETVRTQQRA